MKIYLEKENKTIEMKVEKTIIASELLKELNIPMESVILSKNGNICLDDEILEDTDELKILFVVSGG